MQRLLNQQFSLYIVLAGSAMHVFCCGLPMLLSLSSLGATLSVQTEWLHDYELPLLVISGFILVISGLVQCIATRIDCRTDGACTHAPCDQKKRLAQRIYLIAVGLFLLNLLLFYTTH